MLKKLNRVTSLMFVVAVLFSVCASSLMAQSSKKLERERLNRVMDSSANVEEFRQEYLNYLTELGDNARLLNEIPAVREKFSQSGLKPVAMIGEAKRSITEASTEDLMKLRSAYAKLPGWREMSQGLLRPELRQKLEASIVAKQKGGGIETNAIITDNCQDGINADPSNSDIAVAKGVLIGLQAAADIVPPILNTPAVAAAAVVEGTVLALETLKAIKDDCSGDTFEAGLTQQITNSTSSILSNDNTNTANIVANAATNTTTITGAITTATNTIVNNDNTNKTAIITNDNTNTTTITTAINTAQVAVITAGDANSAAIINNDNSNKTTIVNNDNANALTLNTNLTNAKTAIINNDNTNTTNIVNNDNANKTTIVNNDNANAAALTNALLRSQIEADLATESNAVKVAWYMTPTANGGKLDLVQSIVTLTLANIQAAGGSIGNAQSFLTQANADKAAGNFKSAYDNYRKAYKAAAN